MRYENLQVEEIIPTDNTYKVSHIICTTPEIITLIDADTYEAVLTEDIKFGIKVFIIGLPCHELLMKPEVLLKTGPKAFAYNGPVKDLSIWKCDEDFVSMTMKWKEDIVSFVNN